MDPGNAPLIAPLERIGMRRKAHFVEGLWFKGAWADEVIYAVLRREYMKDQVIQFFAERMLNITGDYIDVLRVPAIHPDP